MQVHLSGEELATSRAGASSKTILSEPPVRELLPKLGEMAELDSGAIQKIVDTGDTSLGPVVLQVLDVKKIENPNPTNERYHIVISDGIHYQQAMLGSQQMNELVQGGSLQTHVPAP